jgi:hypothetical protein
VLSAWRPWVTATRLPLVILALGSLARLWVALGGWYLHDDFPLKYLGVTQPLPSYVLRPYGGHLSPLALIVDRMRLSVFPDYPSSAVIMAAAIFLTGLAVVSILVRLGLPRRAVAVGAVVVVVSPVASEPSLWWASGMTAGLMAPLVAWGIFLSIRWVDSGDRRALAAVIALQVAALGLYTKAVVLPAWILLSLWTFGRVACWRRVAAVVGGSAGVVWVYLVIVLAGPSDVTPGSTPHLISWSKFVGDQFLNIILPGLAGGPWTWRSLYDDPLKSVSPSTAATVVGLFVAGLLVVACIRAGRQRILLLLPGWVFLGAVVHVIGRGGPGWLQEAGLTIRYAADVVIPLSITLAVAAAAVGESRAQVWAPGDRRTVTVILATAFVASSACSWTVLGRAWHTNVARVWAAQAQDSLQAVSPSTGPLLYESVPPKVAASEWGIASSGMGLLTGLIPDSMWATYLRRSSPGLWPALAGDGSAGPAALDEAAAARLTQPRCGSAGLSNTTLFLDRAVPRETWWVVLQVNSFVKGSVDVALGTPRPPLRPSARGELLPGRFSVALPVNGDGDQIVLSGLPVGACVMSAQVGRASVEP